MPGLKGGFFSIGATGSIGKGKKSKMGKVAWAPAPPPPIEYTEEQTQCDGTGQLFPDYPRWGQLLTISNRKITKLAFNLLKNGSPTGDLTFTIRKVSDDSIIVSKLWGDAADVPATWTWCEVEFDTPTLVDEEVRILAEFSGGPAGNTLVFHKYNSSIKPSEYATRWQTSTGDWQDFSSWDSCYRYKYYLP
ncbi:unnamed protein product [marine sediment metagenome]|uniref:Uncharacterized protein n=1 Tax=marine sediment metagenome TaxID=412755 RepID=X1EUF7_9ZZZZ